MTPEKDSYCFLIESLPDAFAYHQIVLDDHGTPVDYVFLEINRAFEAMTGLRRKEIIGKKVTEVLPDIKKAEFGWIGTYGKVALSDKPTCFESFSEPLGLWYDVSTYSDKPDHFAVAFRDISKNKKTEQALRETELAAIYENAPLIMMLADKDQMVRKINGYCSLFAGKKAEEMIGLHGGEALGCLYALEDPEGCGAGLYCKDCTVRKTVLDTLETGRSYNQVETSLPFMIKGKEETAYIHLSTTRLFLKEEQQVLVSMQNITELKKTEQALCESEERLDLAMAVKNEGLWDWNLLTDETYFDKRYYTMAGYQPNEFSNSFNSWAERVHEDDLPIAQQAIDACLKGNSDQFNIEFRFKKKDGQWMWINGKGKIYERDESGFPLRMIGTHTDITDRKQAEAEIRRLNEELEQRVKERTIQLEAVNNELEAFAYSVSHDLRAPLRALQGFSANLISNYDDHLDDQGRHYLDRIHKAALYMSELIDDLLKLSRVTRAGIKKQQVDLSKIATAIIADLRETDPKRNVTVKIDPELSASGDKHLLQVVLENLLGNAWKFSASEKEAQIEVGWTKTEGDKVFFVRDNGAGFDMTYADKLFGAFQRLHGTEEFPGTGVGLATVQRVINRHGGNVWAESEVGKGATLYFTLPG